MDTERERERGCVREREKQMTERLLNTRTWPAYPRRGTYNRYTLCTTQREREREREKDRQRDRETERQRDRETERQRDRETERQRDRETER